MVQGLGVRCWAIGCSNSWALLRQLAPTGWFVSWTPKDDGGKDDGGMNGRGGVEGGCWVCRSKLFGSTKTGWWFQI